MWAPSLFAWASTEDSAKAGTAARLAKAYEGLDLLEGGKQPSQAAMQTTNAACKDGKDGSSAHFKRDSGSGGAVGGAAQLEAKRAALKALVRRGIPVELRSSLWLALSGGGALRTLHPSGHYAQLCVPDPSLLQGDVLFAIEEDLRASVRSHPFFAKREGQAALRRLLVAAAQHSPSGGVVGAKAAAVSGGYHAKLGLGVIAAFALVVVGFDREEEAFWMLTALLEERVFKCCNGQVALGAKVEQKVLAKLVQKKLPKIHEHFKKMDMNLCGLTHAWLASLFTTVLPPETIARVWDCVMCEGPKILLRVSLALLKKYETTILSCTDVQQLKKVLEARTSRETDADALLSVAFKGIGTLASASVEDLRQVSAIEVEEQILEHQKKLDFIICGNLEGGKLLNGGMQPSLQQVM